MIIQYRYQGNLVQVRDEFYSPAVDWKGRVSLCDKHNENSHRNYQVKIEPHELFDIASKCLKSLSTISRMDYKIICEYRK